VIIRISKEEIREYMLEAVKNLAEHSIEPLIATIEEGEGEDIWTFKLTYKVKE
jgi:hypothetical protein